jgi:DNA-binding PadR family transcriptional regulator
MPADDAITRHFFIGFIRLHVLYHAAKEAVCGSEITEELIRHGYRISPGTLYPTLRLLESLGYLHKHLEVVEGRQRKYYQVTPAGRRVLKQARARLQELVSELVEDNDQPFQTIREKHRQPQSRNRSSAHGKQP